MNASHSIWAWWKAFKDRPKSDVPHFHRWSEVIALFALIISGIALYKGCQNEKYTSTSNIQIVYLDADRSIRLAKKSDKLRISGIVVLKNYGRAAAQIVKVDWEPLTLGEGGSAKKLWLAFSDRVDPSDDQSEQHFYPKRSNPILGAANTVIPPETTRAFKIAFWGEVDLKRGREIPNIRVTLTLSNGQALSFLPDIKWTGVGGNF